MVADGVREITLLGQNVNSYGRDLRPQRATSPGCSRDLDAIDGLERIRYTSPHPKDMREDVIRAHAELASRLRAHPPAAAVGLDADPAGDAAHLRPRALPRPRRADPRARPRRRADDGHHRRLPGGDRGGLRADARVAEQVGYDGAFTFIFSPRRGHRRRDARRRTSRTPQGRAAWSASSRSSSAAPASARSASSGGPSRCSSRAQAAPTRTACAAARATTRSSTSPAWPARRSRRGRDHRRDEPDAVRGGAPACPRAAGRACQPAAPAPDPTRPRAAQGGHRSRRDRWSGDDALLSSPRTRGSGCASSPSTSASRRRRPRA